MGEACCERFDGSVVCLTPPLFGDIPVVCTGFDHACSGAVSLGMETTMASDKTTLNANVSKWGGSMKRNILIGSLLMLGAVVARADTVSMGFIGAEGNKSGGVYTFPYDFTINGGGPYQLMCSSFNQHIVNGDQWTATTLNVANLDTNTVLTLESPAAGVTGYLEASFLFEEGVTAFNNSNSDPEGLYNWAVWDLLTGQHVSGAALSAGDETQVQAYLAAAVAAGPGLTPAQFSDVVIYTPTDMSASGSARILRIRYAR